MAAFIELLFFAAVAIGVIAFGRKTGRNRTSTHTSTIRCPNCGSPANLRNGHWECPYCGDSG